jgi:hypothetical protein
MNEENAGIDGDASDNGPRAADEPASEAKAGAKPKQRSAPRAKPWWWQLPPRPGPDGFYGSGF